MKKNKFLQIVAETRSLFKTQNDDPVESAIFSELVNKLKDSPHQDVAGRAKQLMQIHRVYIDKVKNVMTPAEIADKLFIYNSLLQRLYEIYDGFKDMINEEVDGVDFAQKIHGVMYEYAQEAPLDTPTTQDPVRDPENQPDKMIKKGESMKELGQAIQDFGTKTKDIKHKAEMAEYIDKKMMPVIVEIMKQSENPRATKKELLEMFKHAE